MSTTFRSPRYCVSSFPDRLKTCRFAEVKYAVKKTFFLIFPLHNPFLEVEATLTMSLLRQLVPTNTASSDAVYYQKRLNGKFGFEGLLAKVPCRNGNEGDFITNLRVDRGTFLLIVERLTPYIHREKTRMRQSIDVDERVATELWRYGSGDSARTIDHIHNNRHVGFDIISHVACQGANIKMMLFLRKLAGLNSEVSAPKSHLRAKM